jgi:isopentenyldiphosphate isomerase
MTSVKVGGDDTMVDMHDDSDELFDVLDDAGIPTGAAKARSAVHRDGDWHRALHIWVVRDGGRVLLQRRAKTKDLEPGKVDVSVGGHFRMGETLPDALREADEELGLLLRSGQLHYLLEQRSERSYDGALDREFQEVYVVRDDRPLTHYSLRCDEVEVVYEIPIDRAIALYRDGKFVPVSGYDCMARVNNALLIEDDLIEQARASTVVQLEALRAWLAAERDLEVGDAEG